jgi:hypothetical protein
MTEPVEIYLDDDTIDRLARRLSECLTEVAPAPAMGTDGDLDRKLTAAEVAKRWGFDRSWVYQHSTQLGAIRTGSGRRPRLRFDADVVERAVAAMDGRPARHGVVRDRRR